MDCTIDEVISNIKDKLSSAKIQSQDVIAAIKFMESLQGGTAPNTKNTAKKEGFDEELNKKLVDILTELYPEIELNYTEQEILHGEGVMNQEVVDNTVRLSLKVVEALTDWATAKPSKHGGRSQPVLNTIRLKQEAGIRKKLAGKGVPKEQIDFVFEYMKQNDISEIKTSELAERVLMGLATGVEVNTATKTGLREERVNELRYLEEADDTIPKQWFMEEYKKVESMPNTVPTDYYSDLAVPGGRNYQEKEIVTPGIVAPKRGHADFSTDKGIGWYRVDDSTEQDGTLRVLEMQSDMFQKMKDEKLDEVEDLSTGNSKIHLDKSFLQLLNTDNKWVKFFIQSIVQDSQKKGYEKIRFPAGETAAKVEGHEIFR